MPFSSWFHILTVFLLAVVSPGPDFLLVLRSAIARGFKTGLMTGFGVALGTVVWSFLVLFGLDTIYLAVPRFQLIMTHLGGLILIAYGVFILFGVFTSRRTESNNRQSLPPARDTDQVAANSSRSSIEYSSSGSALRTEPDGSAYLPAANKNPARALTPWRGVLLGLTTTTLGNPKALLFYSVIFSTLLPKQVPIAQASLLVTVMTALSFSWFTAVSFLASREVFAQLYRRHAWLVDLLLAVLFILLGAILLGR